MITETAKGFGGDVTVEVTFNDDGTIASVIADVSKETAGIGDRAGEVGFLGKFAGLTSAEGVDTLSGATYTPRPSSRRSAKPAPSSPATEEGGITIERIDQ